MTVAIFAIASGLVAAGLLLVLRGAAGPTVQLDEVIADLHRPRESVPTSNSLSDRLVDAMAGVDDETRQINLELCERSRSKFVQDRLTWALLGALPGLLGFISGGALLPTSPAVSLILAVGGLVAGWAYSVADLRSDAEKRRREFVFSLTTYLELVTILMAGGAGVQTALYDAATIGQGPGFRHIKAALSSAQARREAPWATLGALGRRLGITDLVSIEASMTLAGDGARVRDSLRSRAHAMRDRDLARQEAEAESKSETMVLPIALMFAGFLLFISFPAVAGLSAT